MEKVRALQITDYGFIEEGNAVISDQMNAIKDTCGMLDSELPKGNTFLVELDEIPDEHSIKEAQELGAKVIDVYKTDFKQNNSKAIDNKIEGKWCGFASLESAYFIEESDAQLYEDLSVKS